MIGTTGHAPSVAPGPKMLAADRVRPLGPSATMKYRLVSLYVDCTQPILSAIFHV